MSINYHAYQNRGYTFSLFEKISEQWWERFTGYDPKRIASILSLEYDEQYLYIPYFHDRFRLVLETGHLEKEIPLQEEKADTSAAPGMCQQAEVGVRFTAGQENEREHWNREPWFNECMAVYHLLTYTVDHPGHAGIWVPGEALDGVKSRNGNLPDPLFDPFSAMFSEKTELLEERCIAFGGRKLNRGDVSYQFSAFPWIELQLVFYDAEEDFPAQTRVLVDRQVTDYIHYETVGCLISDLLEHLEKAVC